MPQNSEKTVDLIFRAVDKTGAVVDQVLKNTNRINSDLGAATQPLTDATGAALKFEAALIATGVAAASFSLIVSSQFNSAAADLNKVLSDTDNLEEYKNLAKETGAAYGVSSTEVLESITNYKQAGFTAQEAAALTKSGLDLVIAGGVEASRASELLVSSIKGFGAEASIAGSSVDLLNSVSNEYAVSVDQLLEGFAQFSPVASAAGLSLQETIAVLTPGIEVFRSGSEVANALRTSFISLQSDTKTVTETLKDLGVAQFDSNGVLRSSRDIYFDVAEAFQTLDETQQTYIASQLVGKNRATQFQATVNGLGTTLRIAGDDFEFLGSAASEVALQLATAENAANRVGVNFTNLLIEIGTPLEGAFVDLADAISAIFSTLGESVSDGQLSEIVDFINNNLESLAATAEQVALNLPAALEQADLSGFIDGLEAIGEAVGFVFSDIDLTTVEGLADAIEFVGAAFNSLGQFSAGVIESFEPIFKLFSDIASNAVDAGEAFRELGNISGVVTQFNALTGAVAVLQPALGGLLAIIGLRQGVGLIGSFATMLNVLTVAGGGGVVGALIALSGVLTAGAGGFALGTTLNRVVESLSGDSLSTRLVDFLADLSPALREVNRLAGELNEDTIISDRSIESLSKLSVEAQTTYDSLTDFEGLIDSLTQSADADPFGSIAQSASNAGEQIDEASEWVFDFVSTLKTYPSDIRPASQAVDDLGNRIERAGGTFSVVGNEFTKAATAIDVFNRSVDELSLDEKLAFIEAQTQITVAQIQADAEKITAAFDSIGVSVDSTANLLGDLFSLLGSENLSKLDKLDVTKQIETENERQAENLRLQKKLTEALIAEARARAAAFRKGEGAIKIDGAGLQPHLEAFMWEILSAIQIRANREGFELLLGAN